MHRVSDRVEAVVHQDRDRTKPGSDSGTMHPDDSDMLHFCSWPCAVARRWLQER